MDLPGAAHLFGPQCSIVATEPLHDQRRYGWILGYLQTRIQIRFRVEKLLGADAKEVSETVADLFAFTLTTLSKPDQGNSPMY